MFLLNKVGPGVIQLITSLKNSCIYIIWISFPSDGINPRHLGKKTINFASARLVIIGKTWKIGRKTGLVHHPHTEKAWNADYTKFLTKLFNEACPVFPTEAALHFYGTDIYVFIDDFIFNSKITWI